MEPIVAIIMSTKQVKLSVSESESQWSHYKGF